VALVEADHANMHMALSWSVMERRPEIMFNISQGQDVWRFWHWREM